MFFTDLDRTIIYSNRFVGNEKNPFHIAIEVVNGKSLSFIKLSALVLLREIMKAGKLVPVSARNVDEIKRLSLFEDHFPEWVICDNGMVVLRNGQLDLTWEKAIKKKEQVILRSKKNYQRGIERFKDLSNSFNKNWIQTNNVAYRVLLEDDDVFRETLLEEREFFEENGFILDIQARKAYLLPKGFTKKEAVRYVIECTLPDKLIGAGDADSDFEFLSLMTEVYVPKHHSMTVLPVRAVITNETGIRAGKEIIEDVSKRLYS